MIIQPYLQKKKKRLFGWSLHACALTQEGIKVILSTLDSVPGFTEPQLHM